MKNILFILSMIISATAFSRPVGELTVRDVRMERQNESLIVNFTVEVPKHAVRSNYKQFLVPVVYHGDKNALLPGIELTGRNKARREKQERLLAGASEDISGGIIAREGETVVYMTSIPYAEWMDTLSLRLDRMEEGCCKTEALTGLLLAERVRMNPEIPPVPVVEPVVPASEEKVMEREFAVYFRFDNADMDTTFMDNNITLAKVAAFLKQDGVSRSAIKIMGYASPEGNEAWNEKLAYRRAEVLKNYLIGLGWAGRNSVTIVRHAINWKGLKALVAQSDMPFKADVLQILSDTTDVELTNRKLRQLGGGVPYHYLVTKVYPELRVASFLITNFNN